MTKQNQTHILIRDFVVSARIGIYQHEHEVLQRVCVSIDVMLAQWEVVHDDIADTMSYEGLVNAIRNLQTRHFELVETMAEHLATIALADDRAAAVTVTVEKIEVYPEGRVGTKITRYR